MKNEELALILLLALLLIFATKPKPDQDKEQERKQTYLQNLDELYKENRDLVCQLIKDSGLVMFILKSGTVSELASAPIPAIIKVIIAAFLYLLLNIIYPTSNEHILIGLNTNAINKVSQFRLSSTPMIIAFANTKIVCNQRIPFINLIKYKSDYMNEYIEIYNDKIVYRYQHTAIEKRITAEKFVYNQPTSIQTKFYYSPYAIKLVSSDGRVIRPTATLQPLPYFIVTTYIAWITEQDAMWIKFSDVLNDILNFHRTQLLNTEYLTSYIMPSYTFLPLNNFSRLIDP